MIADDRERTAGRKRDPHMDTALIEAVLELIGSGATLSGLSLVAIADLAGVSRNSLYRRWKTKDALYLDVLAAINRPSPQPPGQDLREDIVHRLAVIVERTLDPRASQMLRALNAEARLFPELHRRYHERIVAPRRAAMLALIRRGVESGEIRADVEPELAIDLLVDPILARGAAGQTRGPSPVETSRRIVDLVFSGLAPRTSPTSAAREPGPLHRNGRSTPSRRTRRTAAGSRGAS